MKKSKKNNKVLLFLIGFLVIAIIAALLVKTFYVPTKTYHSKFLKITIDYPINYQLEERFGTITLKNDKGEIVVDKLATNFQDINGYLQDISVKNKLIITDKKNLVIGSQNSLVATLHGYNDSERTYFFYPSNWTIYTVSTNRVNLYPDLDRIAKSFRYEP